MLVYNDIPAKPVDKVLRLVYKTGSSFDAK